jgi:hypothetical protein
MASDERRWLLIRDATVFTAKVSIEALRDILLIPVGLGSALLGLLFRPDDPERYFRQMLALGERFDGYLNLFGVRAGDEPRVDALFQRIEAVLTEQHRQGGITAGAKRAIDRRRIGDSSGLSRSDNARSDNLQGDLS